MWRPPDASSWHTFKSIFPTYDRGVTFDHSLECSDHVIVGFILNRKGGDVKILILGRMAEFVHKGDGLHVDAHR